MWQVDATEEYLEWFGNLSETAQVALYSRVLLLKEMGPQLGRPYADTLKGSKIANLKELRNKTKQHILRVVYYFDEERKALLVIGGDKKGKDEKRFYKDLIRKAEQLVKKYQ